MMGFSQFSIGVSVLRNQVRSAVTIMARPIATCDWPDMRFCHSLRAALTHIADYGAVQIVKTDVRSSING